MDVKQIRYSLDLARPGSTWCIRELKGNRRFLSRVLGMGLTPGTRVGVLSNFKLGPLILFLRNSQVAIGRKEAEKIIVEQMEQL
ncbi:MAG: ferrous iron transport protein A [Desulfobacterales bacterium]|nr:ferrous iron transport protein A [Desulfobacterales bacterium]